MEYQSEGVWVNGDHIAQHLGAMLPTPAADLLYVALGIYRHDREVCRKGWRRSIGALGLSLKDPVRWTQNADLIEHALGGLTDDDWCLEFVSGRPTSDPEQHAQGRLDPLRADAVALFSGGVDSFAGASVWLESHPHESLLLVTGASSTALRASQHRLARHLMETFSPRVKAIQIPLGLVRPGRTEKSQRSRGFLYPAIGTALASALGIERGFIFENGYGAINPRLGLHLQGAQSNKSTHPRSVAALNHVFRELEFAVEWSLPFLHSTKAEVMSRMPEALRPALKVTFSCDSYPLRCKEKQCGWCGSCMLRQQAFWASQLQEFDRRDYHSSPFRSHSVQHSGRLLPYQAWEFLESGGGAGEPWTEKWPELALDDPDPKELDRRIQLMERYGAEWKSTMLGHPGLARAIGWPLDPAAGLAA